MKFKRGDVVLLTPESSGTYGGEGVIVQVDRADLMLPYRVWDEGYEDTAWFSEDELVLLPGEDA